MVSFIKSRFKYMSTGTKIKLMIIFILGTFITLLVMYLREEYLIIEGLDLVDSKSQIIASYKDRFEILESKIENNQPTGITTVDDSNVNYGNKIEITKGSGDFTNLQPSDDTSLKTYTWYNTWGDSKRPISWSKGTLQYAFAFSKELAKNYTAYERSGVVKLFDRYTLCAVGSYWAYKFGLKSDVGSTYRVYLDTGKTFDIIIFDTKRTNDDNSMLDSSGKYSIAHDYGSSVNIIEFDLLSYNYNFPTYAASGRPIMELDKLLQFKDDNTHIDIENGGAINNIPEFNGQVIALEVIEDSKVTEILKKAKKECGL